MKFKKKYLSYLVIIINILIGIGYYYGKTYWDDLLIHAQGIRADRQGDLVTAKKFFKENADKGRAIDQFNLGAVPFLRRHWLQFI